jgi:DNA-binding response OmpR family regulator
MKTVYDIVLVDDDELVHEFVQRALRRSTRSLTGFESPILARDALENATVRLLIVDTKMPVLDGISLIESLDRSNADRIILCSAGRLDAAQRARTRALGINIMDKAVLYDREQFASLYASDAQ